jgi:hypothetical protein
VIGLKRKSSQRCAIDRGEVFHRSGYESNRTARSKLMDTVTLIRIVAGALAVVVIFIIIWRRRRKMME